ncbi:MAG: hypothetical protein [Microviridae sp.]|nr:MAG: hypothetical protein [Microviridae sp.]
MSTMKKPEQKTRTIKTRANYLPWKGKKVIGKSMTVQGDATSISQMLMRYAQGQPITGRPGVYVEDADLDDVDGQSFQNLDLTEKEDILEGMRAMSQRLKSLELEYTEALKERQKAKEQTPKTE